jgi:hypothetical protein
VTRGRICVRTCTFVPVKQANAYIECRASLL